jgi:energy-coupling factor transport system ATP-binding protein
VPLILTDIAHSYRGQDEPALVDASLEVAQGELVLVLGTTGSGKSTLLKVACGLLEPSGGMRSIDGAALDPESARGVVGMVFQDAESQLFADTVADDVAFGPRNTGCSPEEVAARVEESLSAVGLDPAVLGQRSPFTLSGGESRRAAIAGVLAMRPRYVLFDEPTAGLDVRGRRMVRELIANTREHSGVVVVSHSAEEFIAMADRIAIVANGSSVWSGTRGEALSEPGVFARYGLLAPPLIEVQIEAAARFGATGSAPSFDENVVADALVAAVTR